MTTFTPIDLSQLPAPDVVEQIDYVTKEEIQDATLAKTQDVDNL